MHRWVLSLGWIWNNAGSLCWLQVLSAHSLRGSLGVASKWPNSLPKPQWNEEKKKSHLAPWRQEKVGFPFGFATWWQPRRLPCEGHGAPSATLDRTAKILIHWAAEQFQPISHKESIVENKIPLSFRTGSKIPSAEGSEGAVTTVQGTRALGILSKPQQPFRGKQDRLLTMLWPWKMSRMCQFLMCRALLRLREGPASASDSKIEQIELSTSPAGWIIKNLQPSGFVLFWDTPQHSLRCCSHAAF